MRERTPSADDTPKRAPPAPPGEADVAVRKATDVASAAAYGASKMVASTHSLDDLGVSHIASASQQHQNHHHQSHQQLADKQHPPLSCSSHSHPYGSKSAQDKRSRLSNVINNLRKKVPPDPATTKHKDSPAREKDGRNLETLEKYVMTVLNGVIEDEEKQQAGKEQQPQEPAIGKDPKEDEPSEANESKLDAAVPCAVDEPQDDKKDEPETKVENKDAGDVCEESPKSLGAIILDRLTDRHQEQSSSQDLADSELRTVCQELLDDLLSNIIQAIDVPEQKAEEDSTKSLHCSLPLHKVCQTSSSTSAPQTPRSPTKARKSSLQISDQSSAKNPTKPTSLTVRHLCLYCDRKFLSISLRQRHTERVHRISGGRRSERNSRKPTQQNCQYCVDKCSENLEGLFQHMVGSHSDKYHGCLQCSTRYLSRDALTSHIHEIHSHVTVQMEKLKEPIPTSVKDVKPSSTEAKEEPSSGNSLIVKQSPAREQFSNPGSPEFDNSFYSSVSCNIRENLLLHIDGKLQMDSSSSTTGAPSSTPSAKNAAATTSESSKTPQYQLPIDISLTAVTPVYSKDYPTAPEEYENSSEYAGKPGKSRSRAHPRRVSFEKYNFPRKYDGKEQWSCSIKDLSKFDISTQLTLRKKQQLIKECTTINRLDEITSLEAIEHRTEDDKTGVVDNVDKVESSSAESAVQSAQVPVCGGDGGNGDDGADDESDKRDKCASKVKTEPTVFSSDFQSFMRLKKWNESSNDLKNHGVAYAELTGEWSRPRVYICGACAERYVTLKELEEHKLSAHPNVWCMHFEFSGDQRELYKHLVFLPSRGSSPTPSMKTRQQTINSQPPERICTKCSKSCGSLAELHRHMLECGGDQAWLLGLFGNGKKKCKWRPFGSRSRRRRQRGMKRNIQNSQTPRNNVSRERPPPSGPRVRPSDRESIQKMLANLPAKRATRKVLQENAARSQGRLRNIQSRSTAADNPASRIVKSKAVLRNKLLKNAKSFHRKKNLREEKQQEDDAIADAEADESSKRDEGGTTKGLKLRNARVLSKKKNVTAKESAVKHIEQPKRTIKLRSTTATNEDDTTESVKKKVGASKIGKAVESESSLQDSNGPGKKKKRRIVDPLMSLNASLKAKSQLRTNDGKFARGSAGEKKSTTVVPLDVTSVQIRRPINDPVRQCMRSKLRAAAKMAWKEHTKISRRMTRLSSIDNDKATGLATMAMPQVVLNSIDKDNGLDKYSGESLETMVASKQKVSKGASRNSFLSRRSLDGSTVEEKSNDKSVEKSADGKTEQVVQTSGRGRRPKRDVPESKRTSSTSNENIASKEEQQPESLSEAKTRSQKMASSIANPPTKIEPKARRSITSKDLPADSPKKNAKGSSEASASSPVVTEKEKLGLITRSNSRAKKENKEKNESVSEKKTSKRGLKDATDKKPVDSEVQTDAPSSGKKEKVAVVRKSMRNKEVDAKETVAGVETIEKVEETAEMKKEENDVNEESKEESNSILPANKTVSGKRRGRAKRIVENIEEPKPAEAPIISEESEKVEEAEIPKETSEIVETTPTSTDVKADKDSSPTSMQEKSNSSLQNLSLEHLQQESSNSNMDSGKENSSETIMSISKLKVVRPKKSRGFRKDNKTACTKRSLNSVIGILTEGVNVPVETQEPTVVLTVQTSAENEISNLENACQSSNQETTIESSSSNSEESGKSEQSSKIAEADATVCMDPPISTEVEQKNDEKVKEEAVKEAKTEKQDNPKPVLESLKLTPIPVLEDKDDKEVKPSATIAQPQPTNDIILDLSRRKPKGKGSFLEKIVSKIAKQKDVSLEGESSCHLDIVHVSIESQKASENSEKGKAQECSNVRAVTEIKIESLLNNESSVKLNESATVNIVNITESNALGKKKSVVDTLPKNDKISDSNVNQNTLVKCAEIDIETIKPIESKVEEKDNEVLNGAIEKVDTQETVISDSKITIAEEEETLEEKHKQKSKKRSLESNSPKKNKKKSVDNEDVDEEENKEEISLADIMKLIDRPKLSESQIESSMYVEQETVRPGKRKTPDEDGGFNVANVSSEVLFTSLDCKNDKETTKKSKRKSGQKKNKSEVYDIVIESDSVKEIKDKDDSDLNLEKNVEKVVELKISSDSNTVVTMEKSAIILGPNTDIVEENKISKSEAIDIQIDTNKTLIMEQSPEVGLSTENVSVDSVGLQNTLSEDSDATEKTTKRKRKASRRNFKLVDQPRTVEEVASTTTDESFKIPELTEFGKPSKKRTSKRKFTLKISIGDQEVEKDEDNITDKQSMDEKSDMSSDNFEQNSSMSESEEKSMPKRTSKRNTRNFKIIESEDFQANIKESDDSDMSSASEMEPSTRRRSQRRTTLLDRSRDISVSSTDENTSSMESKPESEQRSNRKSKKNVSLADEHIELFSDNEIVESETKSIEKLDTEEVAKENIEESMERNEKDSTVEERITDNKKNEEQVSVPEKEEESLVIEQSDNMVVIEKAPEIEKSDQKVSGTPESQLSSLDESLDTTEKPQSMLSQEISTSELDESSNLDLQAPKKRPTGNFSIVTKSGKILIVEKKKKLTKEAAKFFCDVCATSFTRKSSLKKHNSSQSHILQTTMGGDKEVLKESQDLTQVSTESESFAKDTAEVVVEEKKEEKQIEKYDEKENLNKIESPEEKGKESPNNLIIEERETDEKTIEEPMDASINKNILNLQSTGTLIIPEPTFVHKSPQEELEDEMLDEEICKITENMSHDEYVLTDHISVNGPDAASTPVKEVKALATVPEPVMKTAPKKKKKEKKKKNLADEHLDLTTPVPKKFAQSETNVETNTESVSTEEKIVDDDSSVNEIGETEKIDKSLEENDEAEISLEEQRLHSRRENKSKKSSEKKLAATNKTRRTVRNRNQNLGQDAIVNVSENSRPKRNQLRPSYKEDENFDFDIIVSLENRSAERKESCRSRRNKNNVNLTESELSDIEKDTYIRALRETSKTKRDKSNNASVTETETSDLEKDVSCKKSKNKKNQNKKKLDKSEKDDNVEALIAEKGKEEKVINESEEVNVTKSNLERTDNETLETDKSIVEEEQKVFKEQTVVHKKKRGRKPKKDQVENEELIFTEQVLVGIEKAVVEEDKEEPQVVVEQITVTNQKQQKSKKNQNKRKKKITLESETIETSDDNQKLDKTVLAKEELTQKIDDKKSKSNIVLDSSFETSEQLFTNLTEILIPSILTETLNASETQSPLSKVKKNNDEPQQQLIFPNLSTENFPTFEDGKNDLTASMLTGFDSDDNSLDTNMSVDIQKLLDDPEMTTEIAKRPDEDSQGTDVLLSNVEHVDVINIKEPLPRKSPATTVAERETAVEPKDQEDPKTTSVSNETAVKKSPRAQKHVEEKKPKSRGRKPKNNSAKVSNEVSSLSEDNEIEEEKQDDKLQKSKNKIVKSVFGRVFGGEKVDKVKEVLDDWQSRSENDSSDSDAEKSSRYSRSRAKKNLRSTSGSKKSVETNGRSRQSKKRAEELISRAFHDDSPVPDDNRAVKTQRLSRRNQSKSASPSKEKFDNGDDLSEEVDLEAQSTEMFKSKWDRKRSNIRVHDTSIGDFKHANYEEQQEIVDKSEESQISQSTLEQEKVQSSEIENTNNEEEEDEDEVLHGRISPLYPQDSSDDEDTLRSTQSSDNEEEPQDVQNPKKKSRSNSNVYSSEKVVIRSPQALARHDDVDGPTEMVTIAPTDAVEDNALDLEMSAVDKSVSAEKPQRQATKVLNFDEELFVECCSRLKATSEKELRGAKKIKLDHSADHQAAGAGLYHQHHHRRDEQLTGHRGTKDRWRDVESQNSLGSLLESVNQLLGEEYNSREKVYTTNTSKRARTHGGHHHHHHQHRHHHHHHHNRQNNASRSVSPNESMLLHRQSAEDDEDNLGYDDSLDVAFEHNNKLRDKIQQRMRESENLIATSFGQKNSSPAVAAETDTNYVNFGYGNMQGHSKSKMNNGLGGLLDKALSNLLHNNEKHDHNASTPMKLLAELACARAPTSTTPTVPEKPTKFLPTHKETDVSIDEHKQQHEHHHHHHHHRHHHEAKAASPKKPKNPIKELFERKKELYEKKQLEKLKTPKSSNKSKKQKKVKHVQHNLPLIRTSEYRGGMVERKKRRDGGLFGKKKEQSTPNKIKDVYDFDEEESAGEPGFTSVLSYRVKAGPPKELNMSSLLSKTIGDTLMNGKAISDMGENLENMVDRKFKDIEKNFAPKSKAPIKAFGTDVKPLQPVVIGPMDEFVERRQKSKRSSGEHHQGKHSGKSKKKSGKGAKKKSRNAWYEDDSSDEFITKLKADDIGVGISKSQRTCSKGKQNLFAEMSSTSSESEFERGADDEDEDNFDSNKRVASEPPAEVALEELAEDRAKSKEDFINDESQNAKSQEDWSARINDVQDSKSNSPIPDYENNKKSESEELSDHPLVIDENHKEPDIEQRTNSDDETEGRTFELDDLYREDSSIVDSDREELSVIAGEDKSNSLLKAPETTASSQDKKSASEKYISIEDALELLDQPQQDNSTLTLQKKGRSPVIAKQSTPEVFTSDKRPDIDDSQDDEEEATLEDLPEKLSSNEKPQRQPENLPLHVFLSRKVQESKKRKQQQKEKLKEEQERILLDLQPTRRQRKCAIGKQGLLAEISSSDEELTVSYSKKSGDKTESHDRARSKQKQRESKEKRKERYIEKKHEQMIAKEQKAIEEAIMRELEEKRLSAASEASGSEKDEIKQIELKLSTEYKEKSTLIKRNKVSPKKHSHKQKNHAEIDEIDSPDKTRRPKSSTKTTDTEVEELNSSIEPARTPVKKRKPTATKLPQKGKKSTPSEAKKSKQSPNNAVQRRSKSRPTSLNRSKDAKEQQPRSLSSRRESDLDGDEEIKAAKSWNKVDEGVGVAIGRRKRAAANQLYYWSSSSDDEETELPAPPTATAVQASGVAGVQDGQEQHGWIVGDSHKKMITMLAMEKQMKEKRRRSENDEQSPGTGAGTGGGKGKKKHRNSTS